MKQEDSNPEVQPAVQQPVSAAPGDSHEAAEPSVSVQLDLPVTQLARKGLDALRSSSSIGSEIGGLLLGIAVAGNPFRVTVSDYELVACNYELGPLYKLGKADLERLDQTVERLSTDSRGLEVVGFFRSHTRPVLSPDADDLAIFASRFNKPNQIALMVRPSATEASGGGVFVWQGGALRKYVPPVESHPEAEPEKPAPPPNSTAPEPMPVPPPVRESPKRATVVPIMARRLASPPVSESAPHPVLTGEATLLTGEATQNLAKAPASAPSPSTKSSPSSGQARVGRCSIDIRFGPDPRRASLATAGQERSRRGL